MFYVIVAEGEKKEIMLVKADDLDDVRNRLKIDEVKCRIAVFTVGEIDMLKAMTFAVLTCP